MALYVILLNGFAMVWIANCRKDTYKCFVVTAVRGSLYKF